MIWEGLLFQKRFVGLCESVKEVSAAASVGASASQRCPPDTRTPLLTTLTVFEQFFLSIIKLYIRKNKLEEDQKRRNFEKIIEYFKQQAKKQINYRDT
jgi:hypothetical protein